MPRRKIIRFTSILCLLLLTFCAGSALAQDDDYLAIIGIMDKAEALGVAGKTSEAHSKYIQAQRALATFQTANPGWNKPTVSYRLKYLRDKIADTSSHVVAVESTSDTSGTKAVVAAGKSPVKLLAAGSEPRQVVRLHPAVGDKQTTVMTMKMAMEMGVAGKAMPAMDIPPMVLTMSMEVKDVSAEGEIAYQMEITDAAVDAGTNGANTMAAAMKTALGGMRGLAGIGKMTTQGIVKSMEMKLPASAAPQLAQTMGQMKDSFSSSAIALPNEAIGEGAKWEYKSRLKSQGMMLDQTFTYELVSIAGDQLTLRSTIQQSAANQKIESSAMPGMKMNLNQLTGEGSGDTTLDLGKIVPTAASMESKTQMGMNAGAQKQNLDMRMSLKLTLEAK